MNEQSTKVASPKKVQISAQWLDQERRSERYLRWSLNILVASCAVLALMFWWILLH